MLLNGTDKKVSGLNPPSRGNLHPSGPGPTQKFLPPLCRMFRYKQAAQIYRPSISAPDSDWWRLAKRARGTGIIQNTRTEFGD